MVMLTVLTLSSFPPPPYTGLQLPRVPHKVFSNPSQARRQAIATSLCFRLSTISARGRLVGVPEFKDGSDGAAKLGTCLSLSGALRWDRKWKAQSPIHLNHPSGVLCIRMPAQPLFHSSSLTPAPQYLVAYDLLSKNEDKLSTKNQSFGSHMTI